MIRKLLIANRGEIALRIMTACRELAIETVAVYSDADKMAPHVVAADRAVRIGPAAAVDSYLSVPAILNAVHLSGADAVHPGYGFLSENAGFASACEAAGVVFVGPSGATIARMGSKIEARRLMQSAGVPVVPGDTPDDQSDEGLCRSVARLALPVIIKPSAGGGGKGMRRISDAADTVEAIGGARREALAAFGDGTLYVERLLTNPRHIEVQIFGDNSGRVVHLFERECSIQRRHQKVIEESPSPIVTPSLRARLTATAVKAARAASYRNAGTVEFLLEAPNRPGDEGQFYFLEMNTRLQVEHPVTEQVTGTDLVRAQILVAGGEPLPWEDGTLTQRGHAIEARVYAEDPAGGFLPQSGRVLLYREPKGPGVRIDAGVVEGSDVSIYYDPLLAKVIASAETRELARRRAVTALRDYAILGIQTNIPFLVRLLEHPRFVAGEIDTAFLDAEGTPLANPPSASVPEIVRAAIEMHVEPAGSGDGAMSAEISDSWSRLRRWGR